MSHKKPPKDADFGRLADCAQVLADAAAAKTIRWFRADFDVDSKSGASKPGVQGQFDPVTIADREAETAIRDKLSELFPDHGVFGEEFGSLNPDARFQWIIDPIDGTAAFIMGWPMWGTLIGLTDQGQPVLGVMDQPYTGERFWSTQSGAMWRGAQGQTRELKTRSCAGLGDAVLSTTHPDYFSAEDRQSFDKIKGQAKTTRYGGDCYAYAMLAGGFSDLIVESGLNSYDVAALIPIVEKAGGVMTTWSGDSAVNGGNIVAAGDARVHEAAVKLLTG